MKMFCADLSELTEITEIKQGQSPDRPGGLEVTASREESIRGWILYDDACRSCTASASAFEGNFGRRGFQFLPLQTLWVQKRLGLEPNAPLKEIRVLTRDGRDLGGADAVIFLARQVWWTRPLCALAHLPGAHRLLDQTYRWVAAHRACTHVACSIPRSKPWPWPGWIGLLLLPMFAMFTRNRIEPWKFMWLMTGAIFLGCKWLTFWRTKNQHVDLRIGRALGYLFAWPGMDAPKFFRHEAEKNSTSLSGRVLSWNLSQAKARWNRRRIREFPDIVFAVAKILFGCLLLFVVARLANEPLLAGWIGMTGMIFILHFGLFHLAAIGWRRAGVDVDLIMNAPWRSKSLSEFWARRWNGAFNQLVLDLFFRRFARSIGTVRAALTAFLISGLLHELVISVPAGAGHGLPTVYFLLQGCGVIAQRNFRIRRGLTGWIFTMLFVTGPAFWLFHPPFVSQVIIPFMHAIHAL